MNTEKINTENNLMQARRQRGLSQEEVAEALDVSRQAVSRWETGAAAPTTDNLIRLSQLYGVSLDALIRSGPLPRPEVVPVETVAKTETETPPAPEGAGKRRLPRWALAGLVALLCLLAVALAYHLGTTQNEQQDTVSMGDLATGSFSSIPEAALELYP